MVSGKEDVRSNEGAFGILTENLYNRSAAFESAIINATVPFLNNTYYHL
jgi:non-canonical (house-cleaning) NTP pyrophosphatase